MEGTDVGVGDKPRTIEKIAIAFPVEETDQITAVVASKTPTPPAPDNPADPVDPASPLDHLHNPQHPVHHHLLR